ncbi:MAG: CPBP family intramembrane metalloprotease [Patescibacteria group bacterium]|nr:CPBP family intramembrane metalloprotease [Patescibacteria group bacterium]
MSLKGKEIFTSEHRSGSKVTPTQRMLNVWAVVLILWAFYRYYFQNDLPIWIDEFVAKPLLFLLPVYYYVSRVELKPFWSSLGVTLRHWRFDLGLGVVVGTIFLIMGVLANLMQHGTVLSPKPRFLDDFTPGFLVAVSFASAVWEELLMRGFQLKRLFEEKKMLFRPVLLNCFLYFFLHIPILFTSEQITGYMILQVLAMDVMFSLVVGLLFYPKRSVLLPVFVHFFYNLSLYFLL